MVFFIKRSFGIILGFVLLFGTIMGVVYSSDILEQKSPQRISFDCEGNCFLYNSNGDLVEEVDGSFVNLSSVSGRYYFGVYDNVIKTILKGTESDLFVSSYYDPYVNLGLFNESVEGKYLTRNLCRASDGDFNLGEDNLTNTIFTLRVGSSVQNYPFSLPDSLEDEFYLPKAFVFAVVEKNDEIEQFFLPKNIEGYYTYDDSFYNGNSGTTAVQVRSIDEVFAKAYSKYNKDSRLPYVYLGTDRQRKRVDFDFSVFVNKMRTLCKVDSDACLDYVARVYVVPIDGKCDFNRDGVLSLFSPREFDVVDYHEGFDIDVNDSSNLILLDKSTALEMIEEKLMDFIPDVILEYNKTFNIHYGDGVYSDKDFDIYASLGDKRYLIEYGESYYGLRDMGDNVFFFTTDGMIQDKLEKEFSYFLNSTE